LSHIKNTAEKSLDAELNSVTLGRPVHFQDGNPDADLRAEEKLRLIAANAGFKEIRFQYEPIAAALSHEKNVAGEQLALVIDIGGGTSDFSLIRLSRDYKCDRDRAQDILANTGVRVGGNDCDRAINLDSIMPHLGMGSRYGDKNLDMPVLVYHELSEWVKINWVYTPQNLNQVRNLMREAHEPEKLMRLETVLEEELGHKILNQSEEMKIALSTYDNVSADLSFIDSGMTAMMDQSRMNELLEKTFAPVHAMMLETLGQAGVTLHDIAVVVLTGGSTALPVFQQWIKAHFSHAGILQDDKLGSVGLGLVL